MSHDKTRSAVLAALLILSTAAGSIAFTGTVAAAQDGAIDADPADPSANATHKTTVEITSNEAGNSLSTIYVNYSVDSEFDGSVENVTTENVKRVGIDMDEDGDIDRKAEDLKNVLHPHNGTVVFDFGGDTDLKKNESVIVVYNNTTNPTDAGNYTVSVDVNHQSKFDPVNATLRIGENVTDDTSSDTETTYEPASDHDEIIDSAPPNPSTTATHHVAIATSSNEVGNSLSNVVVNYHADGSFDGSVQDVGQNDVRKIGFDVDGDGDIEISTMDDLKEVSTSNVGETVTFDLGGNYGIKDDYVVIVVYDDAINPTEPGNYTVEADINTQSTENPRTGSLVLANFTFRNTTLVNISAPGTTYNNTTVLNSSWRNVSLVNDTFTNVTQDYTVWNRTTVRQATWNNTTFTNTTWRNVSVTNATWRNATWNNTTAVNATWNNTTVTNATFANSSVTNVTTTNATWTNTSWTNVTLINTTLRNVTFANVTWTNVTVTNATWNNTTVTNATWSNTSVGNTTWSNTSVTNASWTNATLANTTWTNATFTNTTWTNTTLSNTTWTNASLVNATWANSSFVNATFTNASLTNATWTNSSVMNTTWSNVTVSNATWLNTSVVNATWTDTNVTATDWTNTTLAATFNSSLVTNVTMQNTSLNATSGMWNTTWDGGEFANVTFDGVTFVNATALDSSFQNVSETAIEHHNVTLETLFVENETLVTAHLEDHKFKHEEKYVRHILDDEEQDSWE